MFSLEYRKQVREHVLQLAASDARVVAGAVVGSLAENEGDRWSDLDLTFGVAEEFAITHVLEAWTENLVQNFQAVPLFDLPSGATIYRVFLLPGGLQFDLSFSPAAKFGAIGPKFKLLFGKSVELPFPPPPVAHELLGYAVHHILRARFCIERGRYWHAEYWISAARDYALHLACLRRDLPAYYGRGFDDLPRAVHDTFRSALVADLSRAELMRALQCVVHGLLAETDGVQELASKVQPHLLELVSE